MSYEKKTLLYSVRRALSLHALLTVYTTVGSFNFILFEFIKNQTENDRYRQNNKFYF
jgi:hypothetical protein